MTRSKKPKRHLTNEDQEIWNRITKTADPLSDAEKNFANLLTANDIPELPRAIYKEPSPVSTLKKTTAAVFQPIRSPAITSFPDLIDVKTNRKISKGKIPIDGRIDLHGFTQQHARQVLFDYLENAYYSGKRTILVITGKGNMGRGVLKANVPDWLSATDFRIIVSSFSNSSAQHGGEGALYVRIRRKR